MLFWVANVSSTVQAYSSCYISGCEVGLFFSKQKEKLAFSWLTIKVLLEDFDLKKLAGVNR